MSTTTSGLPALSRSSSLNQSEPLDGLEIDDAEESKDPNWYWTRYTTDTGEYYYFNIKTHETTWKRPLNAGENGNWCEACSKKCPGYYYNASISQFQDDKPSGTPLGNFLNAMPKVKVDFKSVATSSSTSSSTANRGNGISSSENFSFNVVQGRDTKSNGGNVNGYSNRCLVIALADVLNIDRTQFYNDILKSYEDQKGKMSTDMEQSEKNEFNSQLFNNKQIEQDIFFKYFQIYALNQNGLIVAGPVVRNVLTFKKDTQSQIGSSMSGNGLFIRPVNSSGQLEDITVETPIIYNFGNFHYEGGINKISAEMLALVKKNYQDYTEYTNLAPIKVMEGNLQNYPVINKTVEANFIANKNKKVTSIINCKFNEGDEILYNGEQSTILDRTSVANNKTGVNKCESYIIINNSKKVISQATSSDVDIQNPAAASTKKTTKEILTDFLNGTPYLANIQNIENYITNKGGNISAILQVALNKNAGFLSDQTKVTEKNDIEKIINGKKVISGGKRQRKSRRNRNNTKKSKKTRRSKKN